MAMRASVHPSEDCMLSHTDVNSCHMVLSSVARSRTPVVYWPGHKENVKLRGWAARRCVAFGTAADPLGRLHPREPAGHSGQVVERLRSLRLEHGRGDRVGEYLNHGPDNTLEDVVLRCQLPQHPARHL